MPCGGAMHEIRNLKESKVPVHALYSSPFRDDTEVCEVVNYTVYGIPYTVAHKLVLMKLV